MTHDESLELAAAYVLGALEPAEERAVREHLATCDLPHPEFEELGSVVPSLAEALEPVEPSADLRERIIAAAARDLEVRPTTAGSPAAVTAMPAHPAPAPAYPPSAPASRDGGRRRFWARPAWALAAAAAVAIAVLGVWNVRLQGDLVAAQAYRDQVDQVLTIARQQGSAIAILAGDQGQNPGLAAVGPDGTAKMVLRGLQPTTGSQVYEAWVIVGNSAPVPVGELSMRDGVAYLTRNIGKVPPGSTIAFTKEPGPGAKTPTPPIVSSGKLAG